MQRLSRISVLISFSFIPSLQQDLLSDTIQLQASLDQVPGGGEARCRIIMGRRLAH
jgi:hypothetical protein